MKKISEKKLSKLEQDIRLLKKQNKLITCRIKSLEEKNQLLEKECPTYEKRSYIARCRGVKGFVA